MQNPKSEIPNPKSDGPTPDELLAGGAFLPQGRHDLFVYILPVRDYPALRNLLTDEPRLVELYTRQKAGWADELIPPIHEAIITEGKRLNGGFFDSWLKRQGALFDALQPKRADLMRMTAEALARMSLNSAASGDTAASLPPSSGDPSAT